ncbi:MAG: hypothetical protein J2P28_24920, partial [Actinobacteria bacterium]|nr:hypothetical protein [Actinomycetota bacterium]
MTGLEDRLRDELSQLAALAQPETIRSLHDPAPQRRRARAARFLAPVAAVVAVAAVAMAVGVIAPGGRSGSGAPVPAAPALVSSGAVPAYYVLAYQSYVDGGRKIATYAAVHSSATGRTLARVTLPTLWYQGGASGTSITAAADDRTFVVMESNLTSVHDIVWLFRLQVSARGRSIHVTKLPVQVPPTVAVDYAELSPDGTRLAMTAQWNCGHNACQDTGIRLVNLATGALQIWSTHAGGAPFNVSWVGDNAVAFEWQPNARGRAAGYRVLPVSGAPADLLTASQPVASPKAVSTGGYVPNALVTPDGKTVITSEVVPFTHLFVHGAVARIVELDARTG